MTTPNDTHDEDKATYEVIERIARIVKPPVKVRVQLEPGERRALLFLGAMLLSLLIFIPIACYVVVRKEEQKSRATYEVWIKVTGNQKHLTYEEWKLIQPHVQITPQPNE